MWSRFTVTTHWHWHAGSALANLEVLMLLVHHAVPLPPSPRSFAEIAALRGAYGRVVQLERVEGGDSGSVWARIVGYMLLESSFDPESQSPDETCEGDTVCRGR